jgi:nucleoside-diphosphate-sugar epimerase
MRVFITGASGHVGSAVVPELLRHGHSVVGLARSDSSAALLTEWGAEVRRGDLDDLDGLRAATEAADGVIHLAFRHDLMRTGELGRAAESDLLALQAMGEALAGTDKPLIGTAGTAMIASVTQGRVGTEDDSEAGGYRVDAENFVVDLARKGVRSSVVRLPPITYSTLDHHGFVPTLIGFARQHGTAIYVGDGNNRWPAVHTLDAARLYRLALESAPAGTRLHAVGDEGIPFRRIAEAIGRGTGVPVRSVEQERAADYVGFLAQFVDIDNPTSSTRTRELLGWEPTRAGLLAELDQGHYFQPANPLAH